MIHGRPRARLEQRAGLPGPQARHRQRAGARYRDRASRRRVEVDGNDVEARPRALPDSAGNDERASTSLAWRG
jgi:hypothetical protein